MQPRTLTPEDLPWETDDPPSHSVAPTSTRKRQAQNRPKDAERQRLGKRNRRKGNEAQREWANRIGGRNVGVLGGWDVTGPDGTAWEVKSYAKLQEGLLISALEQAEANAVRSSGRDYGLAWRLPNRPPERRWLVVRWG